MSKQPDPVGTVPEQEGQPIAPAAPAAADSLRSHIGRYRVERFLGEGGFGRVYRAYDEQLQRLVAVKVPHHGLVATAEDASAYLAEARTVAGLDHPHIVPVFDVGSTPEFPFFIVSKFIEGRTLAWQLRNDRPAAAAAAALVALVADALQHAHQRGVVHRDVKPGNILLDAAGRPFVADFGLALREQDLGHGPRYAGTPAYMSPEQARGEGHRVDGRSDLFSLGVVFYELLTGRRPFHADSREELLDQITSMEVCPPRQWEGTIPKELERICLKALAKRVVERYTTAGDLADDLRHFLEQVTPEEKRVVRSDPSAAGPWSPTPALSPVLSPPPTPTADSQPVKIVPKGLRSFDAHDADFFLELLPGPRDRDGLPDSIRFWKTRIEETDADDTFSVGLIYGPSGCGKSSMVKAGLLPRLAKSVTAVYVEATAEDTEARLLKGLRRQVVNLPGDLGLVESLAALRRGRFLKAGQKVLLVLDQFEQWLHARRSDESTELVQALRQCDGGRVQCVLMVRDDFWLAVSRFMKAIEVEILEGRNSALVDLFDLLHARKVLAEFGRAYGRLPDNLGQSTREQHAFLDQAVAGLAQEGKAISVRLALFAEMVKGRPWTPATLKEVGGTAGVGVTFLEETFSARAAPPQHRLHQKAAQAVLKALLPETGTDLKGNMRSQQELLEASGYANRPKDFSELLHILDGELRLITPSDPEGKEEGEPGDVRPRSSDARYYQLTHDYLVPSLRDWLTRKQRETRRGRAELRLAARAALWDGKPENRQLPAWWEWLNIRLFTRKKDWTPPQRRMMRRAGRYHLARGLAVAVALLLLVGADWEVRGRLRAQALMDNLLRARTEDVPAVVADMASYRRWLDGPLRQAYAEAEASGDRHKQLHASLALLPVDAGQVDYLYGRLLTAEPHEVIVLREALRPHAGTLGERLWAVLVDPKSAPGQRLRAACTLAGYAEDDDRWQKMSGDITARLVAENALVLGKWAEALRNAMVLGKWAEALQPVRRHLLPRLAALLVEEGLGPVERRTLTWLYADFAEGVHDGFVPLEKMLSAQAGAGANREARVALARRQANAAVALAAMGRWENVSPLLRHVPDPTLRSYLIDRMGPGGVEAQALIDRLSPEQKPDVSARRALLLALGEFDRDRLPPHERDAVVPRLLELYRDDPDPGIHGAAGWLLRQWQQQEKVEVIDVASRGRQPPEGRRWYVNGQGQTMVIVPPGEFVTEGRGQRQKVRIAHCFALAAREVTVAEFRRFRTKHPYFKERAPTEDCPVNGVSWYQAAEYCNWLSEKEGIAKDQWCYEPNEKGEYAEGMKVKANVLSLAGYRLPTEAEWEYACRAGSVTDWSMGDGDDLLVKYGWYDANVSLWSRPVGLLRPNDLGLFDMHGNVWEWCQNLSEGFTVKSDPQKEDRVDAKGIRPLRGSAFNCNALDLRVIIRSDVGPALRNFDVGFRPARTIR